jgi:hypothetical protein
MFLKNPQFLKTRSNPLNLRYLKTHSFRLTPLPPCFRSNRSNRLSPMYLSNRSNPLNLRCLKTRSFRLTP